MQMLRLKLFTSTKSKFASGSHGRRTRVEIVVSDRLMVLCDMTHNHGLLGRDIAARLLSIVLIKHNAEKKAKSKQLKQHNNGRVSTRPI